MHGCLPARKRHPAGREPAIVPLVVATGLAEGASLFLVLAALLGTTAAWAAYALLALLALRTAAWHRYRLELAASAAPKQALESVRAVAMGFLGAGNLLPPALLLTGLVAPSTGAPSAALAGVLAIWGGWRLKFHVIARAAHVQGYAFGKLRRGHPRSQPR